MSDAADLRYAEKIKAREAGTVSTETYPSNPGYVAPSAPIDAVTARYNAKLLARSAKTMAPEVEEPKAKAEEKPADRNGRR